jgi:hypothetical protein
MTRCRWPSPSFEAAELLHLLLREPSGRGKREAGRQVLGVELIGEVEADLGLIETTGGAHTRDRDSG